MGLEGKSAIEVLLNLLETGVILSLVFQFVIGRIVSDIIRRLLSVR